MIMIVISNVVLSNHSPAKDSEGFVVPPPVVNLKRKRPESGRYSNKKVFILR